MIPCALKMPFLDAYLESLEFFGIKPGLESTDRLMKLAGSPDKTLKFIHIAGTNGKGSTGAMLERMLRSVGFKTGFYSSPHLLSITERFRINGRAAQPRGLDKLAMELAKHAQTLQGEGIFITYFEFTTVLAALYFAHENVDMVIWETGMGGQFDATNVVEPELSIITNIALDHVEYLGNTIGTIANEKAGIIKPGKPVFCGRLAEEAMQVVSNRTKELNSPLQICDVTLEAGEQTWDNGRLVQSFCYDGRPIKLALPGLMQRTNFMIAIEVIEFLSKRYNFNLTQATDGLSDVKWPGRIQHLNNGMILDGGHNPAGALELVKSLAEIHPGDKFWIIFANFQDKDTLSTLKTLAQVAKGFIFTALSYNHRNSCKPEFMTEILRSFTQLPIHEASGVAEALKLGEVEQCNGNRILIAGSLYLAGEVLDELRLIDEALNL